MVMQGSRRADGVKSESSNVASTTTTTLVTTQDKSSSDVDRGTGSTNLSISQMLTFPSAQVVATASAIDNQDHNEDYSNKTRPRLSLTLGAKICQGPPEAFQRLSTTKPAAGYAKPPTTENLLRLFMISCYYIVAVATLTLLLYLQKPVNEDAIDQERVMMQSKAKFLVKRSIAQTSPPCTIDNLTNIKLRANNRQSKQDDISGWEGKLIEKDSVPSQFHLPKSTFRMHDSEQLPNGGKNSPRVPMFISHHSPNNRGSLATSLSPHMISMASSRDVRLRVGKFSNNNQWIPITDNKVSQPPKTSRHSQHLTELSNSATKQIGDRRPIKPSQVSAVSSNGHKDNESKQSGFTATYKAGAMSTSKVNRYLYKDRETMVSQPSIYHGNYYIEPTYRTNYDHRHHHDSHLLAHHNWRKARLNAVRDSFTSMRKRVYRRVLICEKTLVSLDYVRSFPYPASNPILSTHFESSFDNNFIDFDSSFDNFFGDRDSGDPSNSTNGFAYDVIDSDSELTVHKKTRNGFKKRSMLTDEDPLVKCDMWDLEKGLKNRKPPESILRQAEKADFDTVRDAINRCRVLTEKILPLEDEYRDGIELMSTEDLMSLFSVKRGLLPGTKWCGLGDQADSYNDLGPKQRIDICCRAHDHCPIRSKPFRNDYGVLNIALYTKSHCDCDADFYRCLREARSRTADMLGNLYFNVMKLQCIREERVKICRETRPVALGFERCTKYEDSPLKTVFKFTNPPVPY